MRSVVVLCGFVFALAGAALAEPVVLQTRVSAVQLHPDGARVFREFTLDLPAGNHKVEFRDFSVPDQLGSLQFDFGAAEIAVSGLSYQTGALKPMPVAESAELIAARAVLRQAEGDWRQLDHERRGFEAEIKAANARIAYLNALAGTNKDSPDLPSAEAVAMTSEAIGNSHLQALKSALTAERAIEDMMLALNQAETALRAAEDYYQSLNIGANNSALSFGLTLTAAHSGKATLSYLIQDANWAANYELHLSQDGATGKAVLFRRAVVNSYASEHWSGVAASLSTARVNVATNVSDPSEVIGRIRDTPNLKTRSASERADTLFAEAMPMAEPVMVEESAAGFVTGAPPVLKGQVLEFTLADPISLQPGGGAVVSLDQLTIDVGLSVKVVPAASESAFLIARMKNSTGGPILPGSVFIFRDGAYIGEGRMPAVGIGEEIEFSFGEYDGIEVRRALVERVDGDVGVITSSNNRIMRFRTTITNHLDFAMPVRVLDSIPVTEQEDLIIKQIANPQPTERDIDGKRGVVGWQFQLEAGKTKNIEFGFEAQWPTDKVLIIR